jgi:UDP-2-acetamido-2,6-beta-L-arabino-hexul-4-ose reductase
MAKTDKITTIGITGQAGFIGTHLYNSLSLKSDRFNCVPFEDDYFSDSSLLQTFVSKCDVIVHLAAVNRHENSQIIIDTNIALAQKLADACETTKSKPLIVFSSSTQEILDNPYGIAKKRANDLLLNWSERNKSSYIGLVIPNVFGPFGRPFYNSVVATFCHQLSTGQQPQILVDKTISLIYVADLIKKIVEEIEIELQSTSHPNHRNVIIRHTYEIKVTALLSRLSVIRDNYVSNGILPDLNDSLSKDLYTTYLSYIGFSEFFPYKLKPHNDERGSFTELMRLNSGGQISVSTTQPGITRGNHFHTRKAERFMVVKGSARIEFRKIGTTTIYQFDIDGSLPAFVDMPVWYTHRITNTGSSELITIFWINEHFNPDNPDTYFEEV